MLFPAMPAVILLQKQNILAPTARAGNAIRPAPYNQIFTAINGISEVEDRFLEGFRFACHDSTIGENSHFVNYIIALFWSSERARESTEQQCISYLPLYRERDRKSTGGGLKSKTRSIAMRPPLAHTFTPGGKGLRVAEIPRTRHFRSSIQISLNPLQVQTRCKSSCVKLHISFGPWRLFVGE